MLPLDWLTLHYGTGAAAALLFLIVASRYLLIAGLGWWICYTWPRPRRYLRKIQARWPSGKQVRSEIAHSLLTAAIFATIIYGIFLYDRHVQPVLYHDIATYGWAWFWLSIPAMMIIHDTYFYWAHRLMHHPRLFRLVHRVHHNSRTPTPWAAFSFHPLEALLEFAIVPVAVWALPLHPAALMLFATWSMMWNVAGHLGFEFFPKGFVRSTAGKWFNTPTHHDLHHRYGRYNFSLYFNFWDRVMGTNHPRYAEIFDQVAPFGKRRQGSGTTPAEAHPCGQACAPTLSRPRPGCPQPRPTRCDTGCRDR